MIIAQAQATDVMDWIQIGSTFGIPVLLLVAIAVFTVRYVWPFAVEQVRAFQEERRQERKAWDEERKVFIATLQQINANQAASTHAIEQIVQSIGRIEADAKRRRQQHP